MGYLLRDIAEIVGGVCLNGHQSTIENAKPIQDAGPGDITFLDNLQLRSRLEASKASAVLVRKPIDDLSMPQVIVKDLHGAFQEIIQRFRPHRKLPSPGIHRLATIDPSSTVGRDVWIHAGVSIGRDCRIGDRCRIHQGVQIMDGCLVGDDCEIYPGVVLYPDSYLGNRVFIQAAAIIGSFGFGYRLEQGRHIRAAQLGCVRIEDDVEIGAATTIDRGTYGETRIGEGTKIDNQVMIGHNCKIGKHNLICAQVGIAGSSVTGDYVVMAGQVGVKDHVTIGDHVVIGAQSGIAADVEPNSVLLGSPAQPIKKEIQSYLTYCKLPEMRTRLKELEAILTRIEEHMRRAPQPSNNERKVA